MISLPAHIFIRIVDDISHSMDVYSIVSGTGLILAALLVPGLAVTFAIYPRADDVTWAERLGLGLVLGLLPQLVMLFITKNLSVAVTGSSMWLVVLAVTALGAVAWRMRSGQVYISAAK